MLALTKWVVPSLVLAVVSASVLAYYQTKRVWSYQVATAQLETKIEEFNAGAILAEKLRRENDKLKVELISLREELKNVEGYDIPLPDDLIDFFDRMRKSRSEPIRGSAK